MNTIKLSDKHMGVINCALEVYYRLKSGQIAIALAEAYDDKIGHDLEQMIESLIKEKIFAEIGSACYGVTSSKIEENAKIAYEIKKTFAQFLALKRNDGFFEFLCDFDGPLKTSKEPLPKIANFKTYKDFYLNSRNSKIVKNFIQKKEYDKMWIYINSLKLNIPNGDKIEVLIDNSKKAFVRVHKPRKRQYQKSA